MFKLKSLNQHINANFVTICLVVVVCVNAFVFSFSLPVIAATSDTASVTLTITELRCDFNIIVHPEKRIPRTGNWGTLLTVSVYKLDNTFVGTVQARSDNSGKATFDLCSQNLYIEPGNYNFYIRSLSHLRKLFPNKNGFNSSTEILDFTTNGNVILAGETSNIFDNKINSLDASTQIRAFYSTTDEKNDLNRDGKVNSLDFSNTVFNFYKLGDPMP